MHTVAQLSAVVIPPLRKLVANRAAVQLGDLNNDFYVERFGKVTQSDLKGHDAIAQGKAKIANSERSAALGYSTK